MPPWGATSCLRPFLIKAVLTSILTSIFFLFAFFSLIRSVIFSFQPFSLTLENGHIIILLETMRRDGSLWVYFMKENKPSP